MQKYFEKQVKWQSYNDFQSTCLNWTITVMVFIKAIERYKCVSSKLVTIFYVIIK